MGAPVSQCYISRFYMKTLSFFFHLVIMEREFLYNLQWEPLKNHFFEFDEISTKWFIVITKANAMAKMR